MKLTLKCCCIAITVWAILMIANPKGGIGINISEKKSKKPFLIAGLSVAALAVVVLLGVLIWGLILKSGDKVFPNVCVSGVNIGGMEADEAAQALETSLASTHATRTLTVQLPDRKLVFDPEMANSPLDTAAMVEVAMAYGRDGNPFQTLRTYINCKESAYILDMEDFLQVDTEYIRELIDKTAGDVEQEMVQSEVSMDEENAVITIKLGYNGRSLDADALYEAVLEAYRSGDLSDITYSYDMVPYDIVDLQGYYNEYCTPASNAYYDKSTRTIVPDVTGYGFDLFAVNQRLALAEEGSTMEIPLQVLEPEITLEEFKAKFYGDVLAEYSVAYTGNASRTTNLRLACEAINGTVLDPGEIFSFNETVGQRTAEKGYKEGIIFANDGSSESELGGGVCQIASMIYYCALMADFQIVEREPHMYVVTYVPYGMDATVYWGALDFQFKNSNETPVMINASVVNGVVYVSLVGTMEHDYTVKMSYELTSTTPYEEVEIVDETKPIGYRELKQEPHTGYTYWSYKNFYDLDGNFLRQEKCDISVYDKYDAEYIVGPMPELPDWLDPNNLPPGFDITDPSTWIEPELPEVPDPETDTGSQDDPGIDWDEVFDFSRD